jgi:hypothetical protein
MAAGGDISQLLRDHIDPLAAFLDEVELYDPVGHSK